MDYPLQTTRHSADGEVYLLSDEAYWHFTTAEEEKIVFQ